MRCFGLLLLPLLLILCSCGTPTASHDVAQNAINATVALEKSLPVECKQEIIKTQLDAIKTQINTIVTTCETEKQVIEQEKMRYKWAFFSLLLLVMAYVLRKAVK